MARESVQKKVLGENDRIASELRSRFRAGGVFVVNLVSSPGSGKTSLLERTLESLPQGRKAAVLTGDIATDNDAARLRRFGFPVRQITTGGACHLDARMVERGLAELGPKEIELLFIENVGNLVCPAGFDLGEAHKIVLISVTEGDDKPLKYPAMFVKSDLVVINKIDLLPYAPCDLEALRDNARRVHPGMESLELSCRTGQGVDRWLKWIDDRAAIIHPVSSI